MCCKNSKKNCIHVQNHKKRGADEDIFHHIAQYSICIILISYTFAAETRQSITRIQVIAYLAKYHLI